MRVAVMQPTYLPWLGYFALMDQVDTFVFLDSVQFARRSWQQRNRIKTLYGVRWLTVPVVKKGNFDQNINVVKIDYSTAALQDHVKTIHGAYARARYFKPYAKNILPIIEKQHEYLSDLTMELILLIKGILGIKCKVIKSSFFPLEGNKADLMANICSYFSATEYVSPVGSKEYLENSSVFEERGIKIIYNEYQHPVYTQLHGAFMEYLSIIDLIFNEGPESLSIIRKGIKTVYAGV